MGEKDREMPGHIRKKVCQLQKRGEAMQGHGPVMATPTTGLSSATAVKASVRPTGAKQFYTNNSMNIILGKFIHILIIVSRIT